MKDEWIKKMWYIYTMQYYSAIRKNKIVPFAATWMDLETLILSEVKSERERQIPYDVGSHKAAPVKKAKPQSAPA